MKAFIKEMLRFSNGQPSDLEGGVLGVTKAYYGCVEAQGRGTLHCHMMVWIDGALNPLELQRKLQSLEGVEFGKRLIEYLDDTIWNFVPNEVDQLDVPSRRPHPDTHRGFPLHLDGDELRRFRADDLRQLVQKNQQHTHTETCFKYCGDGPRHCRFDLDEANVIPESSVDHETGELTLRIVEGLINNYNPTILEALRCNMDIQYIGSGDEAKAVIYYITDYITKSPLKAHVAYAALEMAVKKLADSSPSDSRDASMYAKRALQRTAFSILSNQELTAQQVVSYLMDYEDHFASHKFTNLYWPSFERHIDASSTHRLTFDRELSQPVEASLPIEDEADPLQLSDESGSDIDAESSDGDCNEDEEDVRIAAHDGKIVELSSQLSDYVYRGDSLNDMSLWDFVCLTRKVS
ncbi:hypothetical protein FKP32DRAFT_1547099, partial [Trametes sanguinea]